MKRYIRPFLALVAIAVTILIVAQNMSWQEFTARLSRLDAFTLFLLLLLTAATRLPQAESLRRALPGGRGAISYGDAFWAIAIKGLFNLAVSGAGLVAQGLRLKQAHAITVGDFASATWVQLVAQVIAVGLAGLAGAFLLAATAGIKVMLLLPWMALIAGGIVLLATPRWLTKITAVKRRIPEAAIELLHHRGEFGVLVLLQLGVLAIRLGRLAVVLAVIAPALSPERAFFAFMVGELAIVFPLTPGGLGFRELLLGLGSLGVAGETLILAGLVDRAAALIVTTVLGVLAVIKRR